MSSGVQVKEEPVDQGYEKTLAAEPLAGASTNEQAIANDSSKPSVAKENNDPTQKDQDDEDDDLAWVNDELAFLNDIEIFDVDDASPAPAKIKEEPGIASETTTAENREESCDNLKLSQKINWEPIKNASLPEEIAAAIEKIKQMKAGLLEQRVASSNEQQTGGSTTLPEYFDINRRAASESSMSPRRGRFRQRRPRSRGRTQSQNSSLREEIDIVVQRIKQMKEMQQKQAFIPRQIKMEKLSPPRDIAKQVATTPAPEVNLGWGAYVKQERISPPRILQPPLPRVQPLPPLPQTQPPPPETRPPPPKVQPPTTLPRERESRRSSNTNDDYAFLQKQKEKALKDRRIPDRPSTSKDEPPAKRKPVYREFPLPRQIKTEPMEGIDDFASARNNVQQSAATEFKAPIMKNPVALKLMPQPLRIKLEPVEDFEQSIRNDSGNSSNKAEHWDETPLSHRERVLKFVKETLKNFDLFENNVKLKRRFLYTPTTLIRENADKLSENRSPLNGNNSIQYEFSSHGPQINTEKFGVCKLGERTAKIVKLLGFNAYDFTKSMKKKTLEKFEKEEEEATTSRDPDAYYINAACQTDDLKCNKCIVRKLKKFSDRSVQASLGSNDVATTHSSGAMYDGVGHGLLSILSKLGPTQQTALREFSELILGPAPMSSNDVSKMREQLMDIFTLAQSQGNKKSTSNSTSIATLFNQPDHNRQQPLVNRQHASIQQPIINRQQEFQQPLVNRQQEFQQPLVNRQQASAHATNMNHQQNMNRPLFPAAASQQSNMLPPAGLPIQSHYQVPVQQNFLPAPQPVPSPYDEANHHYQVAAAHSGSPLYAQPQPHGNNYNRHNPGSYPFPPGNMQLPVGPDGLPRNSQAHAFRRDPRGNVNIQIPRLP